MAPLTWRNVDSPSFAGSNDALRMSGSFLGNASDTLINALNQLQESRTTRDSNAVINQALQFQDPASYQAALASGSLTNGIDTRNLNADALKFLGGRNAQLLANEGTALSNRGTSLANDRVVTDNAMARNNLANSNLALEQNTARNQDFFSERARSDGARGLVEAARSRYGNADDAIAALANTPGIDGRTLNTAVDDIRKNGNTYFPQISPAQQTLNRVTGGNPARQSLIQNESGGNFQAQNSVTGSSGRSGHFGRMQFGQDRLDDAKNAGVMPKGMTPTQFLNSPETQVAVENWHFNDIDRRANEAGLDKYIGQTVGGVPITQDAIRSMAHLGGFNGAKRFLESGGNYNPADTNGTKLSDYGLRHGGVLGGTSSNTSGILPNSNLNNQLVQNFGQQPVQTNAVNTINNAINPLPQNVGTNLSELNNQLGAQAITNDVAVDNIFNPRGFIEQTILNRPNKNESTAATVNRLVDGIEVPNADGKGTRKIPGALADVGKPAVDAALKEADAIARELGIKDLASDAMSAILENSKTSYDVSNFFLSNYWEGDKYGSADSNGFVHRIDMDKVRDEISRLVTRNPDGSIDTSRASGRLSQRQAQERIANETNNLTQAAQLSEQRFRNSRQTPADVRQYQQEQAGIRQQLQVINNSNARRAYSGQSPNRMINDAVGGNPRQEAFNNAFGILGPLVNRVTR